jgi:hypothetical protein
MCTVSMVMDHYWEKWRYLPGVTPTVPYVPTVIPVSIVPAPAISPAEVEEFRRLLERAREYDRANGEPDCELAEKRERIKGLADELGVPIDFL